MTSLEDMRLEQLNSEMPCQHGSMQRRAGCSRTGKVWAGYFCPEGIESCKPEWEDAKAIVSPALDAWAAGQ